MTDVTVDREGAILPENLKEGFGHFIPFLQSRLPLVESSFDARNVDAALQDIRDSLARPSIPNLLTIAKLLGLVYFVGTVQAASDTEFQHDLGRTPVLIVHSIPILGSAGTVIGRPEAGGPNITRWSSSAIYVRATATARYAFFVI